MAFWSKETFLLPRNAGIISPFDGNKVDCAAYTLRMGSEYFVTPDSNAPRLSSHTKVRLNPGDSFQIPAGQFAYLLTEEYLNIPKHLIAFVSMKTSIKWRGLVNVSGFQVDGGFEGYFIFAVYNAGPSAIHMERGQDLFLMWIAELDNPNTSSFRQGKPPQKGISPQLVTDVSAPILSLQSVSNKLSAMEDAIATIKSKVERWALWGALGGVILGALPWIIHVLLSHWSDVKTFFEKISSS